MESELNGMVFREYYGKKRRKMVEICQKWKKIIESHLFSEYTHIGKERWRRLNLHRKLLGKRFSPTRLHTRAAIRRIATRAASIKNC